MPRSKSQPMPAREPIPDPVELARIILAGGAFTDADAIRVADAYLFLVDDGGET